MSEPASISSGIAARYAQALFELSREASGLNALEQDVDALDAALTTSADLRDMIGSPVITRDEQANAIAAIGAGLNLSDITKNTLGLMAANRRLFVLAPMLANLRARIADEKGEMTAEVTSATALTATQADKLAATLKAKAGKHVNLKTAVDESLIGGMIVKLGSTMIDTSVKSKLSALQNAMKEVG